MNRLNERKGRSLFAVSYLPICPFRFDDAVYYSEKNIYINENIEKANFSKKHSIRKHVR